MQTNVQIDDDVLECGQADEIRFPVFSVPEETPPLTLDMVKAAESDDL